MARSVNKLDFRATHRSQYQELRAQHGASRGAELAVGGNFALFGALQWAALRQLGLQPEHMVVDVGCGSGRLAARLAKYLKEGRYLGIDVLPELLEHARKATGRPDFRFQPADGLTIPAEGDSADFVCFFSVITHLIHEQSYAYLQDAARVLKPGGRIVASFLDFEIPEHWPVHEGNVANLGRPEVPLNVFIGEPAMRVWADRLGLEVEAIHHGMSPFLRLEEPVTLDDGKVVEGERHFGQSIAVLRKPAPTGAAAPPPS